MTLVHHTCTSAFNATAVAMRVARPPALGKADRISRHKPVQGAANPQATPSASKRSKPASSSTGTPNSSALASLLPASAPATT